MQLVRYKPQSAEIVLKNLLPEESKFIQRALAAKVKDLKPLQVVNELAATITTAYTIAGQQAEQVTLALYVDEFYSKIIESYPRVTIDEIKAAIRSGVYGEYGEFYGLNPKTFIGFVRSYLTSQERKEAKAKFEKPVFTDVKPTDEEIEKSNRDFTNTLYKDFLNDPMMKMEYIPCFIYDVLSKEKIDLSNKTKNRLYKQAGNYLKAEAQGEKLAVLFGKLKKHLTGNNDDENRHMIIAKQMAVWEYFELCKLFEGEIIFSKQTIK